MFYPKINHLSAVVFPVLDPEGDVVFIDHGSIQVNVTELSVDIASLDKNDSHVLFTFYGIPVISNFHGYRVTINWDENGFNTTECVAGYILGDGFRNGTKTVLRANDTTIISTTVHNDTAFVLGNTLYFPESTPYPKVKAVGECGDAEGDAIRICWKLVGDDYERDYDCFHCDSTCDENCSISYVGYTNTFTRLAIISFILISFRRWKKYDFRLKKFKI